MSVVECLFLDLASTVGFAAGGIRGVQSFGTFDLPKTADNIGRYLNHADRCIDKLVRRFSPSILAFEAPWINPRRDNIMFVRKLSGLCNVAEQIADRHEIPCLEAEVRDIASHFLGARYPKKKEPKKLATRVKARELGFDVAGDDDADAIAGLSYILSCRHPEEAMKVSPLFAGAPAMPMTEKTPVRRAGFDAVVSGWGADPAADLRARLELVREFQERAGPLLPAEAKVVTAMLRRRGLLFQEIGSG